jgi:hypothetical protein
VTGAEILESQNLYSHGFTPILESNQALNDKVQTYAIAEAGSDLTNLWNLQGTTKSWGEVFDNYQYKVSLT